MEHFSGFLSSISSVPVVQLCPKLKQEEKKTTELCPELCSFNFIISSVELILYWCYIEGAFWHNAQLSLTSATARSKYETNLLAWFCLQITPSQRTWNMEKYGFKGFYDCFYSFTEESILASGNHKSKLSIWFNKN